MLMSFVRKSLERKSILIQILMAGCLGLILGVAVQRIPLELGLGFLILIILIYAILKRPEIGLLVILIATSSIVYEDQLPQVSFGISLHFSDLLLLGLQGILIVRWLVDPGFKFVKTPLDKFIVLFLGITLLSTTIALYQSSVDVVAARRALRIFSYYLTFFIATNLIRERRQIDLLLRGIFLLATIVAVAIVLQFVLGSSLQVLPGRVETLQTQGAMYEDITRVLPPGWSVVLVSFLVLFCALALETKTAFMFRIPYLSLLGSALVFTFLRSYWAALFIILLMMGFFFNGRERSRLVGAGLLFVLAGLMIFLTASIEPESRPSRLMAASVDRLATLFDSGTFQGQDGSLNWRLIENKYAFQTIGEHPWLGLGLGFTYRPWDYRIDQIDTTGTSYDFRKHIHNGHLWILLQSGVIGYFSFLLLSAAFVLRGLWKWRSIPDIRLQSIALGFSLTYLVVFIAAVANSSFTQWRWTPLLGIMMGVNEVIFRLYGDKEIDQINTKVEHAG